MPKFWPAQSYKAQPLRPFLSNKCDDIKAMKNYILIALIFISLPNLLFADLITLTSGKKFEAIIKRETEEEVSLIRDTGEYTFPKAHIRSIERYSAEENRKLQDKWNAPDYSRSDNIITCYDKTHQYIVNLPMQPERS